VRQLDVSCSRDSSQDPENGFRELFNEAAGEVGLSALTMHGNADHRDFESQLALLLHFTPGLEALKLAGCSIPVEALAELLKIPKALKELVYRCVQESDPLPFSEAIAPLKGTVEKLLIESHVEGLGLLRDFEKLVWLGCYMYDLATRTTRLEEALPRSIEVIKLYTNGIYIVEDIVKSVKTKDSYMPRLREVAIAWESVLPRCGKGNRRLRDMLNKLEAVCDEVDVKFSFTAKKRLR
jgi:hypothetical protein